MKLKEKRTLKGVKELPMTDCRYNEVIIYPPYGGVPRKVNIIETYWDEENECYWEVGYNFTTNKKDKGVIMCAFKKDLLIGDWRE